jgi:hypothetical protein
MISLPAAVALLAPSLLLIMFLPAMLELSKPKDMGPRRIMPDFGISNPVSSIKLDFLVDLEEHQELNVSVKPFLEVVLGALPTLEG